MEEIKKVPFPGNLLTILASALVKRSACCEVSWVLCPAFSPHSICCRCIIL